MFGRFLLEFFRKMQMFRKTKFRQDRRNLHFRVKEKYSFFRFIPNQVLRKTHWNYFVAFDGTVAKAAVSAHPSSSRRERQVVITIDT